MKNDIRFVLDGFPRSGTTTLTRILNAHPDMQCCMEPFHPARYGGHFHQTALHAGVPAALETVSLRWNCLKHVWEPGNGWPFAGRPELNDALVLEAPVVLSMRRRNLLRQFVSGHISRHLSFWVGTKSEFDERLKNAYLPPLTMDATRRALEQMEAELERRDSLLKQHGKQVHTLFYEDVYQQNWTVTQQVEFCNNLFQSLGFKPLHDEGFRQTCQVLFDPAEFQWASSSLYASIPNARVVDDALGNDQVGRLFA